MRINYLINQLKKPQLFFFVISFILISLWFSQGLVLGGTEVGVPTYKPTKIFQQIIWSWWEEIGPGLSYPSSSASIPIYVVFSILEQIGLSALHIQVIMFFIIIYLQGVGVSLLFKKLFPQISSITPLIAGIFYIFNPFMMTYVWHRFIYAGFFLSAAFPLLILIYVKLVEDATRRFKYIVSFLLVSFAFSYMYSAVAPAIAIWISLFCFYLYYLITSRYSFSKIRELTLSSVILLVTWVITNFWWIYSLMKNQVAYSSFSVIGNVDALTTLKDQTTLPYVIRGINSYSMFTKHDWGNFYDIPLVQFFSWTLVILSLFIVLKLRFFYKILPLLLLLVVGLFLAKGASNPLGSINTWLYNNIFFLGIIRNPFEKLGLLVILPLAILAAYGFQGAWDYFRQKWIKITVLVFVGLYLIYLWPMFSDRLFGSKKYPPFFTPPPQYQEMADFLTQELQNNKGKILHLPLKEGDSVTYNWASSYNGVDLSFHLFPGVAISKYLYLPAVDNFLDATVTAFYNNDRESQRKIMQILGVKFIVLDKNVDWAERGIDNPENLAEKLNQSEDLEKIKEAGGISIYKLKYPVSDFSISNNPLTIRDVGINNPQNLSYLISSFDQQNLLYTDDTYRKIEQESHIIFPNRKVFQIKDYRDKQELIAPTLYAKYLPGSFKYNLTLVKEKFELALLPDYEKPMKLLLLTTKRLDEIQKLSELNDTSQLISFLDIYNQYLKQCFKSIEDYRNTTSITDRGDSNLAYPILEKIMNDEENALNNLIQATPNEELKTKLSLSKKLIDDFQKSFGLENYFPLNSDNINEDLYTYQFILTKPINEEVVIYSSDFDKFGLVADKQTTVFIDGKPTTTILNKTSDNYLSFGNIRLDQGVHEISLSLPKKITTVEGQELIKYIKTDSFELLENGSIQLSAEKEDMVIEYPISDYLPNHMYHISFGYRVVKGEEPRIEIYQESDPVLFYKETLINDKNEDSSKKTAKIYWETYNDIYNFSWKNFNLSFGRTENVESILDRSTVNPVVRLTIPIWNNCYQMNRRDESLCKDPEYNKRYNRSSITEINNFKIMESFSGDLAFIKKASGNDTFDTPQVEYIKKSPVEYMVNIKNSDNNTILAMNQTYHNGWKAYYVNENGLTSLDEANHIIVNSFANGWTLDKKGDYSLLIKFIPQEYLYTGSLISITGFVFSTLLLLWSERKRRRDGHAN